MLKKICFALLFMTFFPVSVFCESAYDIMKKSENLASPETARAKIIMSIQKRGREKIKGIELSAIKSGENEKVLLKITEADSGNITKILTHTKKSDEDIQWLKMPNGRVKRITTADRSGSFANSHFFYEDLRSRKTENYNYKILGEEKAESYNCYKIEAVPKPGKSIYDKAVFYIIKSGEFEYFAVKADIYFDGYLYKRLINYDLKTVKGVITPFKTIMYRINSKGKTLGNTKLEIKALEYNNSVVTESMFNQERL
ncbi:MAG: outer membrane lipoprotein-sorting protein [Thermodesulfobacteriota bacterium]